MDTGQLLPQKQPKSEGVSVEKMKLWFYFF